MHIVAVDLGSARLRMLVGFRKWLLTIGAACIAELRDYFNSLGFPLFVTFYFYFGLAQFELYMWVQVLKIDIVPV